MGRALYVQVAFTGSVTEGDVISVLSLIRFGPVEAIAVNLIELELWGLTIFFLTYSYIGIYIGFHAQGSDHF